MRPADALHVMVAGNQVIKADEEHILSVCLQKAKTREAEVKRKQKAEKLAAQGTKRKEEDRSNSSAAAKRQSSGIGTVAIRILLACAQNQLLHGLPSVQDDDNVFALPFGC